MNFNFYPLLGFKTGHISTLYWMGFRNIGIELKSNSVVIVKNIYVRLLRGDEDTVS